MVRKAFYAKPNQSTWVLSACSSLPQAFHVNWIICEKLTPKVTFRGGGGGECNYMLEIYILLEGYATLYWQSLIPHWTSFFHFFLHSWGPWISAPEMRPGGPISVKWPGQPHEIWYKLKKDLTKRKVAIHNSEYVILIEWTALPVDVALFQLTWPVQLLKQTAEHEREALITQSKFQACSYQDWLTCTPISSLVQP